MNGCTKYYWCVNGSPDVVYNVPDGTLFDVNLQNLVWADQLDACVEDACSGNGRRRRELNIHQQQWKDQGLRLRGDEAQHPLREDHGRLRELPRHVRHMQSNVKGSD